MKIRFSYLIAIFSLIIISCEECRDLEEESAAQMELVNLMALDKEMELNSNELSLENVSDLVSINTGDSLVSLLNRGHGVFLRISERHCGLCIESEIDQLKQLQSMVQKGRVGVLATFNNKRSLRLLTNGLDSLNIPVFLVKEGVIELPIEEVVSPYYFCLRNDFITNQMFLPMKKFPALTESYFRGISHSH